VAQSWAKSKTSSITSPTNQNWNQRIARVDGATSVRDLEADYEVPLPRDEGFETLAGLVWHTSTHPQPGE